MPGDSRDKRSLLDPSPQTVAGLAWPQEQAAKNVQAASIVSPPTYVTSSLPYERLFLFPPTFVATQGKCLVPALQTASQKRVKSLPLTHLASGGEILDDAKQSEILARILFFATLIARKSVISYTGSLWCGYLDKGKEAKNEFYARAGDAAKHG